MTAPAHDDLILQNGAHIAVIGGGPSGTFFSLFALEMARMVGKDLTVTIFEPKDFSKDGPAGCNRCGGIISELMVQMLAMEGIILPDNVVRRGINAYRLHTEHGDVNIPAPGLERRIASVYRGLGPKGVSLGGYQSFDRYLLDRAVAAGAVHRQVRIDGLEFRDGRPVLFARGEEQLQADLVVGAFGLSDAAKLFAGLGFGYAPPPTIVTAIAELKMTEATVQAHFGNAIDLFLLPDDGLKFAAMIPKGEYVTLCLLGTKITAETVAEFLAKPVVRKFLPESLEYTLCCRCLPKMNVGAPAVAFADRVVVCGDSGSTRLFKDGIGAAYLMGKAVAKTVIFHGVGHEHFDEVYRPVYDSLINDNRYGRLLFAVTDIVRKYPALTRSMLATVRDEQASTRSAKVLSTVLWEMFTGNERYRNIFPKTLNPAMNLRLIVNLFKGIFG